MDEARAAAKVLGIPPQRQSFLGYPDGGLLHGEETVSGVDLDQLFNTLDARTRTSLQRFLKGSADSWRGAGKQANQGLHYLNPLLSTSSRLFQEVNADTPALERFVVDTSKLVTGLADRRDDISALVGNLNSMMGAIGSHKRELADAVSRLPDFMRRANTTFVNLRGTLDDLDPLVAASKPVAPKLRRFLAELGPFARDAVPTLTALDRIVSKKGKNNDLTEVNRLQVPLTRITAGPVSRNGKQRSGAFAQSVEAIKGQLGSLAFFRPYTTDLVGWFDDFGHSGIYDANGGMGRIATTFNAFTASATGGLGNFIPAAQRPANFKAGASIGNTRRCPLANERDPGDGSTPFTDGGKLNCDPKQVPVGP